MVKMNCRCRIWGIFLDGKFQVTAVQKKIKTQLLPNDSLYHHETGHCVKTVQIRSFLWSIFSCVQSEYRKIWIRKNSVFGHFSRSGNCRYFRLCRQTSLINFCFFWDYQKGFWWFKWNRSWLIHSRLLNIRSKIWRRSIMFWLHSTSLNKPRTTLW